ncbi:copper homeostasis protein CutC [Robiginitalea sp. IMCC44478]|uniref:copper homeostasis protein CutC n=1 Tax=Robiginitalea sp. IMCC44478 TaxID=3459122 RepID=UPI0040437AB1
MILEVCAHSLESALIAQQAGADRLEFCSELAIGGITPSHGMLQQVREKVQIPVHVLIRPRSGNFTYSEAETAAMLRDIELCRSLGFEGVVSGCLTPERRPDLAKLKVLRNAARGMHLTFHRAFDWVSDPETAFSELIAHGIDGLLSSGQRNTAAEGLELLKRLQGFAAEPIIVAGGGINASNIGDFSGTGFQAIHLSGIPRQPTPSERVPLPMNNLQLLREDFLLQSDQKALEAIREHLDNPNQETV